MHPDSPAVRTLRGALIVLGIVFIVGRYPLTRLWPAGWSWTPAQSEYLQMILAIYATLGVFLLLAAKEPLRHSSLIWFTVWSSAAHGGVMAVQALRDPTERGHLPGDVLVLLVVALALGVLTARAAAAEPQTAHAPAP
jgi:membrane protein DedA with SNARE-associated domain